MFVKIIFVLILTHTALTCDYKPCQDGSEHTMCIYPKKLDRDAPKCSSEEARAGLTIEYKKYILDAHNKLRQKVARGEQPGQPSAANMRQLHWCPECETIAQRFANGCEKDGLPHDRCRDLKDGTHAGQNSVNDNLDLKKLNRKQVFYTMVQRWYDEVQLFPASGVANFQFDMNTGHYTQVVWATTDKVGCGYIEEDKDNEFFQPVMMKCNYVPAGNMMGAPMYIEGKPCSQCPEGTHCSSRYDGLCTDEEDDGDLSTGSSLHRAAGHVFVCYAIILILNLF